jgi:hypothetical protein
VVGVAHAGELALGAEGDDDLGGQVLAARQSARLAVAGLVDLELPLAVQGLPGRAFKVGARVFGANRVGLERRGFEKDAVEKLQTAMRLLTRSNLNTSQAVERIRAEIADSAEVEELLAFIAASERGVIK